MKTIYRIAKSELNSLFCSPIAWLVLVIFTFQVSMAFTDRIIWELKDFVINNREKDGLTVYFLLSGFGSPLFPSVLSYLYLYFPLLTMGLMSREYSSGSIKLLYSSPITSTQIVFGKYLSMMFYGLIMLAIVTVYVVFYMFVLKDFDYPVAITGLIGIYLIMCLYSAVGLFVSCLTSYQVVAAIGTFAALTILQVIGGVLQGVDFWRDITYWICSSPHGPIAGLINSGDVLYYILMPALFIGMSIMKLQFARQSKPWYVKVVKYLVLITVIVSIGYVTSRRTTVCITDLSRDEQLTLTPKSREILKRYDGQELTLTTYVNIMDEHMAAKLFPRNRIGDMSVFSKYYLFKPDMKFKYIYYYDHVLNGHSCCAPGEDLEEAARKQAKVNGLDFDDVLSPEEMRKIHDLSGENNQVVRILEDSEGNWTYLRMFNDLNPYPGEQEISVALLRMKEGAVKMGALYGHGEREMNKNGDREIGWLFTNGSGRGSLINQGFDPVSIPFTEDLEIPDDVQILLIIDPKEAFLVVELEKIRNYVASGRHLIIATDVNRSDVMSELLADFGVQALSGMLVLPRKDEDPTNINAVFTPQSGMLNPTFAHWASRNYPLSMTGVVALNYTTGKGYNVVPLIVSPVGSWTELETTDFAGETPVFNPKVGETNQQLPVVLALTRQINGKEQRIMIFGDADWMTTGEFSKQRVYGVANGQLTTLMCSWMTDYQYPTYFPRPAQPDNHIKLSYQSRGTLKLVFVVIFPAVILLLYFLVWFKRRGK